MISAEHNHSSDAERIEAAKETGMLFAQTIDSLAINMRSGGVGAIRQTASQASSLLAPKSTTQSVPFYLEPRI